MSAVLFAVQLVISCNQKFREGGNLCLRIQNIGTAQVNRRPGVLQIVGFHLSINGISKLTDCFVSALIYDTHEFISTISSYDAERISNFFKNRAEGLYHSISGLAA